MSKIISVQNLCFKISDNSFNFRNSEPKEILKNISFELEENLMLAIAGETGSGKSTLAKLIAAVLKPTGGTITYSSELLGYQKINPVQMLFQNNFNLINPERTADSLIKEALKLAHQNEIKIEREFYRLVNLLEIKTDILKNKSHSYSGGERQKVALARLLAVKPRLLILDEPFSDMDKGIREKMTNILKSIREEFEVTLIFVTHNLATVRNLADEILIMKDGIIVEQGAAENILNKPATDYFKKLLSAELTNS